MDGFLREIHKQTPLIKQLDINGNHHPEAAVGRSKERKGKGKYAALTFRLPLEPPEPSYKSQTLRKLYLRSLWPGDFSSLNL